MRLEIRLLEITVILIFENFANIVSIEVFIAIKTLISAFEEVRVITNYVTIVVMKSFFSIVIICYKRFL